MHTNGKAVLPGSLHGLAHDAGIARVQAAGYVRRTDMRHDRDFALCALVIVMLAYVTVEIDISGH
jgi:hypothetical protein